MEPFDQRWTEYADAMLPEDTPEPLRQKMKEIFYTGAWAMLTYAERMSTRTDDIQISKIKYAALRGEIKHVIETQVRKGLR